MTTTTTELDFAARRTDPETSHEAARRSRKSGSMDRKMKQILRVLISHPGSTYTELFNHSKFKELEKNDFSRRLPDLERLEMAFTEGRRRCSIAKTNCQVWYPSKSEESIAAFLKGCTDEDNA